VSRTEETPVPDDEESSPGAVHDVLLARGRRLELATIGWNVMEVFVAIGLGLAAGSLALVAFGLDSLVEVFASVVVIWYIRDHHNDTRVRRSLRLVALAFGALGAYLLVAGVYDFCQGEVAHSSPVGIAYLAITACVMFGLALAKRSLARDAHSDPLAAEAHLTLLDGYLATSILVALVLNAVWSTSWADPAAALVVAAFCFREAMANWAEAGSSTIDQLA
jgi:divalent metal cation (Fe/Co/Zn/Cd) transporter